MTFNEAFQVSIAERNSKFIDNGLEIIIENILDIVFQHINTYYKQLI